MTEKSRIIEGYADILLTYFSASDCFINYLFLEMEQMSELFFVDDWNETENFITKLTIRMKSALLKYLPLIEKYQTEIIIFDKPTFDEFVGKPAEDLLDSMIKVYLKKVCREKYTAEAIEA